MMFDPQKYSFMRAPAVSLDFILYETKPVEGYIIGCYTLIDYMDGDFLLEEVTKKSMKDYAHPMRSLLYRGKIPSDEFAFELFKNIGLEVPIIQRDIKLDTIL